MEGVYTAIIAVFHITMLDNGLSAYYCPWLPYSYCLEINMSISFIGYTSGVPEFGNSISTTAWYLSIHY